MKPTVPDESNELKPEHLQAIVTTFGNTISQAAASNAEVARLQSDANVKVAELEHSNERLHVHYGFALRVLGGLAILAVIGGGFWSGRYELVTHALAGVGGLFAGYGLAKATR